MKSKFKVVISAYNCFSWLPRCLDSIASQTYRGFDVVVVDNASTEPGQWEWTERFCRSQGWLALRNEENSGPLGGLVDATRAAECNEEDIIVHVDADDWLAHDGVFAYLDSIYSQGCVDMTYGQFSLYSTGETGFVSSYHPMVVKLQLYRKTWVLWSHLRTFKSFLWDAIEDGDLRAKDGNYWRYAPDHAFMNPMLEMAGERHCALDEVLYTYNDMNPGAETYQMRNRPSHIEARYEIRQLLPYDVLDRCRK